MCLHSCKPTWLAGKSIKSPFSIGNTSSIQFHFSAHVSLPEGSATIFQHHPWNLYQLWISSTSRAPPGSPFSGFLCLEFSPCLKSPPTKINGTDFLKGDIFPKMGDVDDFVDVFRKPNCFFERYFWSYKLLHVPRTSWGFKLPPWKLRWFAHVLHQNRTHVHLFFLATVIDFWSPLSPRRVCHFLFLARKLHGRVADFVGSNFFLTRHRCCLSLLNVFFFAC